MNGRQVILTSIVKVLKDKVELRIPEEFAFMDDEQQNKFSLGQSRRCYMV